LIYLLLLFNLSFNIDGLEDIYKEELLIDDNFGESLLEEMRLHPLDINQAGIADLLRLPGLDEEKASHIIKWREEKGGFKQLEELLAVKGMTKELVDEISPFLTLTTPGPKEPESTVEKKSYPKVYFKLKSGIRDLTEIKDSYNLAALGLSQKDWKFYLLTERDYQEELFDWTSFNINYQKMGKRFIIGDFLLTHPELLSSPPYYHLYKPPIISGWQKDDLAPLRFAAEVNYQRGVGLNIKKENSSSFIFFSAKGLTALIDSVGQVKKIYYSGQHSDSTSQALKGRLKEKGAGGGWQTDKKELSFGVFFLFNNYNEKFLFGKNLLLTGVNLKKTFAGQILTAEIAKSLPGSWALVMKAFPNGKWFGPLGYRLALYYLKGDFFSLYGKFPNISPGDDKLLYDFLLFFSLPQAKFTFSYNTKSDWGYDSLPQRIRLEWQSKEDNLRFRIYQRRYIGEKKRGSGIELNYKFKSEISGGIGIEDKYQKERRGFKFSAQIIISYQRSQFTLQGYKTVLNQGIDFYHFSPEGYQENELITEGIERIIFGWAGKIKDWSVNLKLGVTHKGKFTFDFKEEIKR